jgi:regulator of sigma D
LTNLYSDLSSLGEAMAERIESEDKLLREISDSLESPSKSL